MNGPKDGEIWWMAFSPSGGCEQPGNRPGLVVSRDAFNELPNNLFLVLPITRRGRDVPHHVSIEPPEGGLEAPSFILADQIQAADLSRFDHYMGVASPVTMSRIRFFLRLFLL